jgi:thiol:disulfide interchange protein DsbD
MIEGNRVTRIALFLFFALSVLGFAPRPGLAAVPQPQDAGPVVDSGKTQSSLISAKDGSGQYVVLHLTPDAGWHTYWRNPGDTGLPTELKLTLPEGVTAQPIEWPAPERIVYGPLINYGYSSDVYLPVLLSQSLPEGTVVKGRADWLICKDICIPEGADLTLTVTGADNGAFLAAVKAALPKPGPAGAFEVADKTLRLNLPLPQGSAAPRAVTFFPETDGVIANATDATWAVHDGTLTLGLARGLKPMPQNVDAVVSVTGADGGAAAYRIAFAPGTVPAVSGMKANGATATAAAANLGFGQALLFAFLGGIILNLMPCVFPVLSMKALAIARSAKDHPARRRMEGLSYLGGVLLSFAVIAGVLLALRAGGEAIGWGFQLQSPVFVTLMAFVLFLMGLSFSGLFSFGTGVMGVGQGLTERSGHWGAFFTGALATLVATPCTAPFMAGALGTALLLPAAEALPLFLMLGLGLAFPILVISFSPAVGRILPRPGAWMETFRQFLAFLLYATVVWLLWVLGRQVGVDGLAIALFGLILLAFMVWALKSLMEKSLPSRWLRGAGAFLALLLLAAAIGTIARAPIGETTASAGELAAETYSPELLQQRLQQGDAVFVNFTADWCITCLANERVALSSSKVEAAFKAHDVHYMKGDWTNQNAEITAALQKFGRSGVPLYLYYAPGGDTDNPVVLPQLLTPGKIVDVIEKAPARAASLQQSPSSIGG